VPQGLQVWDGNGTATFDTNYRVARQLGAVQPGLGQSIYYDDRLYSGIPWAFYVFDGSNYAFGAYDVVPQGSAPVINFSGNAMIVTRSSSPPYGQTNTCTVYFGVR